MSNETYFRKRKTCPKCKRTLPLTSQHFYYENRSKGTFNHHCKECCQKILRIYRSTHKEKAKEMMKAWVLNNRERIKSSQKAYLLSHPNYQIYRRFCSTINMLMTGRIKTSRKLKYFDCTMDEFKKHLESKFTDGMTWDNYGKGGWEIDHIVPCSSFDLSKEEDRYKCYHYTNTQPLWKEDNVRKLNKVA